MAVIVFRDPDFAVVYGDTSGDLADHAQGADDVVDQEGGTRFLIVVGDADALTGHAVGGNDTVTADARFAEALGDAFTITDHARGGDDVVTADSPGSNFAIGDAETISGHGSGGNDRVFTGEGASIGDALLITDHGRGGDDTISISGESAVAYGDAETMSGYAKGGDDMITAHNYGFTEYGDAEVLKDHAQGGNDTLVGLSLGFPSKMYGDGQTLADYAKAGDDVLISGSGDQLMWGDAEVVGPHATRGVNRFVFAPQNGHDQIMDFQPGKDHIELDGFGFSGFQALAAHFQATPDGVLISFDTDDDILVRNVGVNQLHAADFILT